MDLLINVLQTDRWVVTPDVIVISLVNILEQYGVTYIP